MRTAPSRICPFSLAAAIALSWLPILSAEAQNFDPIEAMPQDTLVYVGWDKAWSGFGLPELTPDSVADMVRGFNRLESPPDPDTDKVAEALKLVLTAADGRGGVGLFRLDPSTRPPTVELGAVLDLGDKLKTFAAGFEMLLRGGGNAERIQQVTIEDATLSCIRPDREVPAFYWGQYKNRFVLAVGEGGAKKLIDGLSGKGTKLTANGEFAACRKKLPAGASASAALLFCDTAALLSKVVRPAVQAESEMSPEELDKLLAAFGINGLKSALVDCDRSEYGPRTRAYLRVDGPYTGILKLWDQKPLSDDDLQLIPRDATFATVWNLDLSAIWAEATRIAAEVAPGSEDQLVAGDAFVRNAIGFSIAQDLLPAFGDTWAVFDSPDRSNYIATGLVLVADARQPADLGEMLKEITRRIAPLAEAGNVKLLLKEMKHGGRSIHYVLVGGVPCPFAPAWSFIGGRVVFALFPQTVAAVAGQVDAATRKASILDHPDVKAALAALPKSRTSFGYMASREAVRTLYPFYLLGGTMAVSMSGGSGDLATLRTLEQMLSGVRDCVGVTSVEPEGVMYAGVGTSAVSSASFGSAALMTSILLPSLGRARELAKRTKAAADLRGIGMAVHAYAADNHDAIPESLDALMAADIITRDMLISPRQPGDKRYVLVAKGRLSDLKPGDVLAYEPLVGDEGTNVLFVDGHVEWVTPPRVYELIGRNHD